MFDFLKSLVFTIDGQSQCIKLKYLLKQIPKAKIFIEACSLYEFNIYHYI